jgi:acetylornithine deacetylase/succinyl-diaminopimelate desuccinylase-like protein
VSDFLIDTLVGLAKVPSAVPLGADTLIAPEHPLLVDYVQHELRPRFEAAGAREIVDLPRNQFAVRLGTGEGPCLALVAYTPTQHHNLMAQPWSGRIDTPAGIGEPCVFGQGVTQNKVHQACLLSLAQRLAGERFDGTLLLCVNNEGRSSHECSDAMLDGLPFTPDLLIQLFCTGFDVTVGNRGRIDLHVHVRGPASHSSTPPPGGGVIDVAGRVLARIRDLNEDIRLRTHPQLGAEQAVPYQVLFDPLAPHTLPASAKITVDRRLLPGTDPLGTATELRTALDGLAPDGYDITVEPGVTMLPTLFERTELLAPLDRAIYEHLGEPARHTIYGGSFDAGGPAARGVPTVMFGVPDEGDILGDDFVRVSHVRLQERILRGAVANFFGAEGAGSSLATRRSQP